jgi:RHS repeat-associated protein
MTDEVITAAATGEPVFAEHADWQNDGQKADVIDSRYNADGSVLSQITFAWAYDADSRLASETLSIQSGSGSSVPTPYADVYGYDLSANRVLKTIDGGDAQGGTTIQDTYNADSQLTEEVASGATAYDTASTFDQRGNLATQGPAGSPTPDTYVYDLRNNMTAATVGGQATTYAYDSNNVLSSETTGGVTTYSLNDPNNPTGNTKAIQQSATPGGAPTISFVLGLQVEAQSDVTYGTRYLLVDGHGSTRALADTTGAIAPSQTFDYDAYGTTLTNAATAETAWLFGGDGVLDHATGWTYHLARWREGSQFTQSDTFPGTPSDPATLARYTYGQNDPTMMTDPTGHFGFLDILLSNGGGVAGEGASAATAETVGAAATEELEQGISVFEGVETGIMNLNFQPSNVNPGAAFLVGFTSGLTTEELKFAGVPCSIANGVGAAVMDFGNDYLANGSAAFSMGGLMEAIGAGVIAGLTNGCFVAGTPVLLGDGTTEEAINDIQVGQRVATDGGVANSPDGLAASDPNATAVDPATWREVTIDAGDWEVNTLEPLSWIQQQNVATGASVDLNAIVDLQEMGVPTDLFGTIESISACPTIASGPGRVVLTTVSHLNDDLYDLTLTDTAGNTETLGVSGTHRFYDESSGWTHVQDLHLGETLRGDHGDLTVTNVIREPGTVRVYNMTVEGDHVYYVGDLTALVHNSCKTGKTGHYEITFGNDMKYVGKGDYLRAIESAEARIAENGGLKAIQWAENPNDVEALIAEAEGIRDAGGIGSPSLLNIRNSPGAKYL